MKSILVIDDDASVRQVLKMALMEGGYEVFEAENGRKGVQLFTGHDPDIVLTDVNMPEMSGIEVTTKIKELSGEANVLIMTGYGTEELVIEALRAGASNYIKKPIVLKELYSILDGIYLKKQIKKRHEVLKDVIVEERKSIVVDNDVLKVWGAVNQVFFNIPQEIVERKVEGLKLGLYEIIVNAIEHGNLGITYEEKESALNTGSYHALLEDRLERAEREGKKVFVHSFLTPGGISVEVLDEGKGFDFSRAAPVLDPEEILSAHGRGILLATLYFDRIEYKEPGNRVILSKKFDS